MSIEAAVKLITARGSGTLKGLPPQEELARPRDRRSIEIVSSTSWSCRHCEPPDSELTRRPVDLVYWITGPRGVPYGRCSGCGQLYVVEVDEQ